ncbi:MAG: Beta-monoglucosyldiacylglycerol synthase [Firmicutes bacterium ADurb.Bin419]|nr:MAG: Beta-monoglucosyldiacylglycerol synthase [Firmicutes bacterium ADurb.Bin419]
MLSLLNNVVYTTTQLIQVIIFIAGCYFFGISFLGWIKRKENDPKSYAPQKKFALIIAAHNEEKVIGHVIESLHRQNYPKELYDVYVIADNCSDNTAQIAADHGALVYKRANTDLRGKGHALEWMFAKIFAMSEKYDAISVFDADNLVTSNFLLEMNAKLCQGYKVVQGYIDSKNPYDSWITCSYSIAFWLSNRIFQLPRHNLGLSCSLCGTGFCVDVETLKKIGWGATCLTEDLEFTMKLALSNLKVAWAHNAIVYDEKPLTLKQSWNQRKRWMQGHADCASRFLGPLFKKAFRDSDLTSFDNAVYLFQPIRFIFIGLITIMMWIQTVFPQSPFFNLKYVFPVEIWYIFAALQFLYGPFVILTEKRFEARAVFGFLIYPLYCLTWMPITIQGFMGKNNKDWNHTHHSREISISDLEKA